MPVQENRPGLGGEIGSVGQTRVDVPLPDLFPEAIRNSLPPSPNLSRLPPITIFLENPQFSSLPSSVVELPPQRGTGKRGLYPIRTQSDEAEWTRQVLAEQNERNRPRTTAREVLGNIVKLVDEAVNEEASLWFTRMREAGSLENALLTAIANKCSDAGAGSVNFLFETLADPVIRRQALQTAGVVAIFVGGETLLAGGIGGCTVFPQKSEPKPQSPTATLAAEIAASLRPEEDWMNAQKDNGGAKFSVQRNGDDVRIIQTARDGSSIQALARQAEDGTTDILIWNPRINTWQFYQKIDDPGFFPALHSSVGSSSQLADAFDGKAASPPESSPQVIQLAPDAAPTAVVKPGTATPMSEFGLLQTSYQTEAESFRKQHVPNSLGTFELKSVWPENNPTHVTDDSYLFIVGKKLPKLTDMKGDTASFSDFDGMEKFTFWSKYQRNQPLIVTVSMPDKSFGQVVGIQLNTRTKEVIFTLLKNNQNMTGRVKLEGDGVFKLDVAMAAPTVVKPSPEATATATAAPTKAPTETPPPTAIPLPSFEQEFDFGIQKPNVWTSPMNFGSDVVFRNGGTIEFADGSSDPVYKLIADYLQLPDYRIKVVEITAPIDPNQKDPNRVQSGQRGFTAKPPYQIIVPTKLGSNFQIVRGGGEAFGTFFRPFGDWRIAFNYAINSSQRMGIYSIDPQGKVIEQSWGEGMQNDFWYVFDFRVDQKGQVTHYSHFPIITADAKGNLVLSGWKTTKQASVTTYDGHQGLPEPNIDKFHWGSGYGKGAKGSIYSGPAIIRSGVPLF